MNFEIFSIPRGQLNNVILSSMFERDMYGYEIIEDILNRSHGKIEIKQPSLYSSLKRLEQAKLLSSYWTDSDLGGDRHYYSITDLGKKTIISWMLKFVKNNKLVSDESEVAPLKSEEKLEENQNKEQQEEKLEIAKEEKPLQEEKQEKDKQLDLFDEIKIPEVVKETKIERASRIADQNEKKPIVQLRDYLDSDRKNEYLALKQKNKSFVNTFSREVSDEKVTETIVSSSIFAPKERKEEQKQVLEEKQEQKEDFSKFRDGIFITNDENKEEKVEKTLLDASTQTENLVKDYRDKTDGIFLERDEVLETTPSVKKIEPAALNIESKNNAYSYFKFEENKPQKEEIKEESIKPQKNNFFSSYQGLATYFAQQNIVFKEYRK